MWQKKERKKEITRSWENTEKFSNLSPQLEEELL